MSSLVSVHDAIWRCPVEMYVYLTFAAFNFEVQNSCCFFVFNLPAENTMVCEDGVRPFLSVAGGSITCQSITGEGSVQPQITLKMEGASASLQSVKLEIVQRLQRHFMLAGLKVEWDD